MLNYQHLGANIILFQDKFVNIAIINAQKNLFFLIEQKVHSKTFLKCFLERQLSVYNHKKARGFGSPQPM